MEATKALVSLRLWEVERETIFSLWCLLAGEDFLTDAAFRLVRGAALALWEDFFAGFAMALDFRRAAEVLCREVVTCAETGIVRTVVWIANSVTMLHAMVLPTLIQPTMSLHRELFLRYDDKPYCAVAG